MLFEVWSLEQHHQCIGDFWCKYSGPTLCYWISTPMVEFWNLCLILWLLDSEAHSSVRPTALLNYRTVMSVFTFCSIYRKKFLYEIPDPGIEPTYLMPSALAGWFFTSSAKHTMWFQKWGAVLSSCSEKMITHYSDMNIPLRGHSTSNI